MALEAIPDAFESNVWTKLKSLIGEREIIGHSIVTFDLPYLYQHFGITASHIVDTKDIRRILMNGIPEITHDLKSVLQELGIYLLKDQGDSDWGLPTLSPEQLTYAANDVFYLHELNKQFNTLVHTD